MAEHEHSYESIIDDLSRRYADTFTRAEVARAVEESRAQLEPSARVTSYLPIFVRRFAKQRLMALAQERGDRPREVMSILFVCRGTEGRSQMAAAFTERYADGHVQAFSAGTDPLDEVRPDVHAVMLEKGIDLTGTVPRRVTEDATEAADIIVSMGIPEEALPTHGKHTIQWDIDPVADSSIETTRRVRDAIDAHVHELLEGLPGTRDVITAPPTEPAGR